MLFCNINIEENRIYQIIENINSKSTKLLIIITIFWY